VADEVIGTGVAEVVAAAEEVTGAAELEGATSVVGVASGVEEEGATLEAISDDADSVTIAPLVPDGPSTIEVVGKTVELEMGSGEEIETTVDSEAEGTGVAEGVADADCENEMEGLRELR
jgi:hypothetical protein